MTRANIKITMTTFTRLDLRRSYNIDVMKLIVKSSESCKWNPYEKYTIVMLSSCNENFINVIELYFYLNAIYRFRGGSSRGGPSRGGFDRGGRGTGGGRGGPTKRGGGPPSSSGPSKRPRFDQPSSQPSNGYATQPPR